MRRKTIQQKNAPVKCQECRFAVGYHPMYVGDDWRKWGTSTCVRIKRHRRVDVLSDYDGCSKGVKK